MDKNFLHFGNNQKENSTDLVITMSQMVIWPNFVSFE